MITAVRGQGLGMLCVRGFGRSSQLISSMDGCDRRNRMILHTYDDDYINPTNRVSYAEQKDMNRNFRPGVDSRSISIMLIRSASAHALQ